MCLFNPWRVCVHAFITCNFHPGLTSIRHSSPAKAFRARSEISLCVKAPHKSPWLSARTWKKFSSTETWRRNFWKPSWSRPIWSWRRPRGSTGWRKSLYVQWITFGLWVNVSLHVLTWDVSIPQQLLKQVAEYKLQLSGLKEQETDMRSQVGQPVAIGNICLFCFSFRLFSF